VTRWWWVRHGPTHQAALTGWRDVPADLSDHAALNRLAATLPAGAALVSSDLSRARATADLLAEGRVRLPDEPGLREINFGEWDGRTAGEIAETWPELSRSYWQTPGDSAPPGGESWNRMTARVGQVIARLDGAGHGDIVAVAHQGVILAALAEAARLPPRAALAFALAPLSLTRLTRAGEGWRVEGVNLPP
jgi:broad specificity phosphatase PhoE